MVKSTRSDLSNKISFDAKVSCIFGQKTRNSKYEKISGQYFGGSYKCSCFPTSFETAAVRRTKMTNIIALAAVDPSETVLSR